MPLLFLVQNVAFSAPEHLTKVATFGKPLESEFAIEIVSPVNENGLYLATIYFTPELSGMQLRDLYLFVEQGGEVILGTGEYQFQNKNICLMELYNGKCEKFANNYSAVNFQATKELIQGVGLIAIYVSKKENKVVRYRVTQ